MKSFLQSGPNPEKLAELFADQLILWIKQSHNKPFHLALSGGKTPSLLFDLLAKKYSTLSNWETVHFWWGDERMVPPNHPESNYREVNDRFFIKAGINPRNIHRIFGESSPIEEVVRYSREIVNNVPVVNNFPEFDLIMLGLGDDGHTASIFPDQMYLLHSFSIAEIAIHPTSLQQRITLTGNIINNSGKVAFLVTGQSKSAIFNSIYHDKKEAAIYPASYINPTGELYWFVDDSCLNG